MLKSTMPTLKLLPVAIRLPFFRVNVSATRASLTRVSRRDKHHWDSGNCSFVVYEYPELIKRPVVRSTSFSFATWFLVEAIPNSGQVFKCQRSFRGFCLSHQLFADVMVQPFLKPTFTPREPSQQSSRVALAKRGALSARAFGLNVSSDSTKSVSNRLNLFTIPRLTCGRGGDIPSSKIDSDYLGCFTRWWSVYLNHKVDVVIALVGFIQRCTGEVLSSKQCNLIPTNGQLKVNSSTLQGHTYSLGFFHISKCADVQANRSGSELVDLFDCLGVVDHPSNGLANVIGFQSRCFSNLLIDLVMKLSCIPAIISFSHCQYLMASIGKSPQSLINLWSILYRDYKLALYRQALSHKYILAHPTLRRLKPQSAFLSGLLAKRGGVFAAQTRSFPHRRFS